MAKKKVKSQNTVLYGIILAAILVLAILIILQYRSTISGNVVRSEPEQVNKLQTRPLINDEQTSKSAIGTKLISKENLGHTDEYIIELKDDPVLAKYTAGKKSAVASAEVQHAAQFKTEALSYRATLRAKQLSIINSQPTKFTIKNQYTDSFNGMAVHATPDAIQNLRTNPNIKNIFPNGVVQATLMDSVPLIQSDAVWKLDADGNPCATSGKPCLTGKETTIGIIDTGIDYTHEDLRSSGTFERNFEKIL